MENKMNIELELFAEELSEKLDAGMSFWCCAATASTIGSATGTTGTVGSVSSYCL